MKSIAALQEILPYVTDFHGKTFVIKVGGEVCMNSNLEEICGQISLIHHMGIRVVLVHGGGPQMDELSERLGIVRKVVGGRRITDDATLNIAKMVFAGQISTDIVAALRKHGASGVGLSGVDALLVHAEKRPPRTTKDDSGANVTIDFGNVGDIKEINPRLIELLLSQKMIPVIASLGGDTDGRVLNINADTIASQIAQKLKAEKLIVMSNVPGILRKVNDPSTLVSYADIDSLNQMIESGVISGGMLPKIEGCIDAVRNGVPRTHMIDGTKQGSLLLELFLNEGCGTMIVDKKERAEYERWEVQG